MSHQVSKEGSTGPVLEQPRHRCLPESAATPNISIRMDAFGRTLWPPALYSITETISHPFPSPRSLLPSLYLQPLVKSDIEQRSIASPLNFASRSYPSRDTGLSRGIRERVLSSLVTYHAHRSHSGDPRHFARSAPSTTRLPRAPCEDHSTARWPITLGSPCCVRLWDFILQRKSFRLASMPSGWPRASRTSSS